MNTGLPVLRFRLKYFVESEGDRSGEYLHRRESVGMTTEYDVAVSHVPESSRTPVRVTLTAAGLELSEPAVRRVECEVYLSPDDAREIARQLQEVTSG